MMLIPSEDKSDKGATVGRRAFLPRECLIAIAIYAAALLVAKLTFAPISWSARDARDYHFPVINFFIRNGFHSNYPQLVAMLPGMHAFFALCADVFHLKALEWDGLAAFLIQSVWGAAFIVGVMMIYRRPRHDQSTRWPMMVPLLCSSIPFYSWLWPTTDLGAISAFVLMIVLLENPPRSHVVSAVLFAALVLVASSFRQNYAVLGIGFGLFSLLREPLLWRDRPATMLVCAVVPLVSGALAIIACYALWGGLTPASERWHGSSSALHLTTVLHVVAYTGLMCWPLLYQAIRRVGAIDVCGAILVVSLGLAVLIAATIDLSYDKELGRSGSLVWSLIGPAPIPHSRLVMIVALFTSGFFLWLSVATICIRDGRVSASVLLAAVYFVSLAVQSTAWQRYIEPTILVSLVSFFGFPERQPRGFTIIYVAWFALYAIVTMATGWSGLSVAGTLGAFGLKF